MADGFSRSPQAPNASDRGTRSHGDLCQNLNTTDVPPHFRHTGIRTHYCSSRHALHRMALHKCLWPNIPLLSHICRLGPQLDLLRQVQGCSGDVLWGLNLEFATGCNHPRHAPPADLGTSPFTGEEVWALWNLFSGWLVSFFLI